MEGDQPSDQGPAGQTGRGTEAAFAELYQRYFDPVYDFAIRLSGDQGLAALALQRSFLRAHQALRAGEPPASLKVPLFAVALSDARERLRGRRPAPQQDSDAFAVVDTSSVADPVLASALPELAQLAWLAAQQMRLDEYALLDLSVRRELTTDELASALAIDRAEAERASGRSRDAFEESFSALLLFDRGRSECVDLDFLAGDDQWSPSLRRRVTQHIRGCPTCQSTRQRYRTGVQLLAELASVPAPAGWQDTILERLQQAARSGASPQPAPAPSVGTPRPPAGPILATAGWGDGIGDWFRRVVGQGGARWPLLAGLGGSMLGVIVVVAALCGAGAFDGGDAAATLTPSPTATATTSVTTTATATETPPTTATPVTPTASPLPATASPPPATATPEAATATPMPATATPPQPSPTLSSTETPASTPAP